MGNPFKAIAKGLVKGGNLLVNPIAQTKTIHNATVGKYFKDKRNREDAKDASDIATADRQLLENQKLIAEQTQKSGDKFRRLAEQELGGLGQFQASQRAQEQLARQQALSASQGAQRALQGRLASQGLRGGNAIAAQMAGANQAAQLQANIGQQMIAQRADKEQALREKLLSSILAGKQFGSSQTESLLAQRANIEAARQAKK